MAGSQSGETGVEPGSPRRPRHRTWLLLAVGAAALLLGVWGISQLWSGRMVTAGYGTAREACSATVAGSPAAPASSGSWRVFVRADSGDASALVMVSGGTQLLCVTRRDERGRFSSTSSTWGPVPPSASAGLTYDGGDVLPGRDAASSAQAVTGWAPAGSAAVEVLMSDGSTARAALVNGRYLAIANTVALPERIVAADASGAEVAVLANLHGLRTK